MTWPATPAMAAINRKRDAIHVASVLYYHFDWSLGTDSFFDRISVELVDLHRDHPDLVRQGYEWEAFEDWDGSTGFHLPLTPYAVRQAEMHIEKGHRPMSKKDLPHISTMKVREGTKTEWDTIPSGRGPSCLSGIEGVREKHYILTHLDGHRVTGALVSICVRLEAGVPRLVYMDGGWPTYETWVYGEKGEILAHFPGHLVEKERKD